MNSGTIKYIREKLVSNIDAIKETAKTIFIVGAAAKASFAARFGLLGVSIVFSTSTFFNQITSNALANSPQRENRYGVFVQDEFRPLEFLILYLGAWYDYNDVIKEQYIFSTELPGDLSPRFSAVYLLDPHHSLRASWGRAFRKPSFWEYGLELEDFAIIEAILDGYFLRNPDAANEHIESYELDYLGQVHRRAQVSASLYFNRYWDTLVFGAQYGGEEEGESFNYTNVGDYANSYGGEITLDLILPWDLKGFVNYSLLLVSAAEADFDLVENLFPQHTINAGFRWLPPEGPTFSLLFHHASTLHDRLINPTSDIISGFASGEGIEEIEVEAGNYILVNLRASYRFWKNRLEAGIKGFNLLNRLNRQTRQYPAIEYEDDEGNDANYGGEIPALTILAFLSLSL